MQYTLEFTESAWDDLGFFRKYEQNIITEEIHLQLTLSHSGKTLPLLARKVVE